MAETAGNDKSDNLWASTGLGISDAPAWSKYLPKHKQSRILNGVLKMRNDAEIEELFDEYADDFDRHLVEDLEYDVPAKLRKLAPSRRFDRCLDLGCGTGLAGQAFCDICDYLEGVDLGARMVDRAKERQCYDALHCRELVTHLKRQSPDSFDLLISADVLIYISDLVPLFSEAWRVLREGGLFFFTTESATDGEAPSGSILRESTDRIAHTRSYMLSIAKHFEVVIAENDVMRTEDGLPVPGDIFVLRKTQTNIAK